MTNAVPVAGDALRDSELLAVADMLDRARDLMDFGEIDLAQKLLDAARDALEVWRGVAEPR